MNLDHYDYFTSDTFLNFEFYSEGPNGKIKKVIRFSPQHAFGITYFNLGFGDYHEDSDKVDDKAVTNNNDKHLILATIARAVLDFMEFYPDKIVHAKGSTPARTRLYQMSINANWVEIERRIIVFGLHKGHWKKFEKNINYDAFLGKKKKL